MLKLIYENWPLNDRIKCKVCGTVRESEQSCIVLVQTGIAEGSLWTVCQHIHCVGYAMRGCKASPPTVKIDQ